MSLSSCILGRHLRLALLLLLLASQGFVNAHELGSSHTFDSHLCSVCLAGHGLDSAVNVHSDVPPIQVAQALITAHLTTNVFVLHNDYYFTRAPPGSL